MNTNRSLLWRAGTPVRAFLVASIRVYRAVLSPVAGGRCRFSPSCSHYAETAISTRGALVGSALAGWRVLRCNPFGRPGLDPVPVRSRYDSVIQTPGHVPSGHGT